MAQRSYLSSPVQRSRCAPAQAAVLLQNAAFRRQLFAKLYTATVLAASLLALFLFTQKAHADSGIRGGYGFSHPSFSVDEDSIGANQKGNYLVGLGNEFGSGPVGLIVDVLYAKRSRSLKSGTTQTFTYVETPIMALVTAGIVRFSAGAYYGFSLGKIRECESGFCDNVSYDQESLQVGNTFVTSRKGDYGFIGGIGISAPTPKISLTLDLRYRYGMQDFGATDSVNSNWRGFDLVAGILF